ncbi:MAG TPA: hypothetical protein VHE61_12315 [Opitutaceae bacterium]|nr:hypothetical protein [Opitutaceae bacterium]
MGLREGNHIRQRRKWGAIPLAQEFTPQLLAPEIAGRQVASHNDVGSVTTGTELASIPGVPTNPLESALVVVLPPGNYCAVLTGNNGAAGTGLVEVNDLRVVGPPVTAER